MIVQESEYGNIIAEFNGSDIIEWPAWAECYIYAEELFGLGKQVWILEDWLPAFHDADEFLKPLRDDSTVTVKAELPIVKRQKA